MKLKIATVPGDGTGLEVIDQAMRVLNAVRQSENLDVAVTPFDFGAKRYLDTGKTLDDADLAELKNHDAIFLGAVGHPNVKPGILERGLLLKMRFELDQYINLRPVKLYPGIETPLARKTPDDIDFVCVRENTEDLYCGNGGIARKNTPQEISTQEMIATRFGVERAIRFAFDIATTRPRKLLTLVHKTNVLTHCGDTWFRAFNEIGETDYPQITREYHHVDACCMYLVAKPEIYDTIVVPNMFGDIITDLGAAIAGGMGIAASGNLNPRFNRNDPTTGGPSMFEPVHGSSPDIAGKNLANPLAAIDTLSLLLTEIGRIQSNNPAISAGQRVKNALLAVTPKFTGKTLDRSGYACDQIANMVIDAL